MNLDESKMIISEMEKEEAERACLNAECDFLAPDKKKANVVGMGVGVKWQNGQSTGEPAIIVLVTRKVGSEELVTDDQIPKKLEGMQTDVLEIGELTALGYLPLSTAPMALAGRIRPCRGGYSVGHARVSAGTIGTCVYDILPGGSINPPRHGTGKPGKYYILSNNHVLANSNNARVGDPILQPGAADGGRYPADRIAVLERFIPITFDPPVPRSRHNNVVDAAVARGEFSNLDREIYWIGCPHGWRLKTNVAVGTLIRKTGRTTNFTTGRITAVAATVDISYGAGRVARFRDQIVATNMADGGDSGSLITSLDNVAIGLLFAGSSSATIINQIENVRSLLKIEVAERFL
ncbi:MAG: hypothetical protein AB1767_00130 [Bacillota bacterium]